MAVVAAMGMKTTTQARANHGSGDTLSDHLIEDPSATVTQEPIDKSSHSPLSTDNVVVDSTISESHPLLHPLNLLYLHHRLTQSILKVCLQGSHSGSSLSVTARYIFWR